jgi:hypothetical protein
MSDYQPRSTVIMKRLDCLLGCLLTDETTLGVDTAFHAQRGKTQIIFSLDKPAMCLTLGVSHPILPNVPVIRCSRYQAMVRPPFFERCLSPEAEFLFGSAHIQAAAGLAVGLAGVPYDVSFKARQPPDQVH